MKGDLKPWKLVFMRNGNLSPPRIFELGAHGAPQRMSWSKWTEAAKRKDLILVEIHIHSTEIRLLMEVLLTGMAQRYQCFQEIAVKWRKRKH